MVTSARSRCALSGLSLFSSYLSSGSLVSEVSKLMLVRLFAVALIRRGITCLLTHVMEGKDAHCNDGRPTPGGLLQQARYSCSSLNHLAQSSLVEVRQGEKEQRLGEQDMEVYLH